MQHDYKNKLLANFPRLKQHSKGRDIMLVPSGAAGIPIRKTREINGQSKSLCHVWQILFDVILNGSLHLQKIVTPHIDYNDTPCHKHRNRN